MLAKVHVLEKSDFQKWEQGTYKVKSVAPKEILGTVKEEGSSAPGGSLVQKGAILYKTKTCNVCHTTDGSKLIGPSFKGAWGSKVELEKGAPVLVDENYIRESLMDPVKKVRKGYVPTMPTFRGQLSDEEINQLIAFIKSLKGKSKK